MKPDLKAQFFPLCDLHHSPMRRVMLEDAPSNETQSFHQCERRDCSRIFRAGYGYSDFGEGRFDAERVSSRKCPACGGTLYLCEVDRVLKVELWECTGMECSYSAEIRSPASR
jgi:ssDNA-binding Zn-finger/Zn-ribbon topoisomerase 1